MSPAATAASMRAIVASLIASSSLSWLMPRRFATSPRKSEAGVVDPVAASAAPPPSTTASAAAAVTSHRVRFTVGVLLSSGLPSQEGLQENLRRT
jgi:hypothetical protein